MRIILSPADEARALEILATPRRRTNETLEELSRTVFKSWFVDFDACLDPRFV